MSLPSNYKPSPLSFGSPRTSPFQRPSSPLSPSSTIRPSTPPASPQKPHTPIQTSPSKLHNVSTPPSIASDWTPHSRLATTTTMPVATPYQQQEAASGEMMRTNKVNADALAKVPPGRVREMREAFQVLDRDGDGAVTREDVVDMLTNLGQNPTPTTLAPFFPPSSPASLSLPLFLSQLSTLLSPLSSRTELLNAFAAFDDDDSGQIDVAELRDALLHTAPETGPHGRMGNGERGTAMSEREIDEVLDGFRGKRTFDKRGVGLSMGLGGGGGRGKGDVFRYQEFVGSVVGVGEGKEGDGAGL